MAPLYTVYVLMDPLEPEFVKYVGVTTQTLTKRVHDMMSACTKQYTVSYNTPSGIWLRSVVQGGYKPLSKVMYEGEDRQRANDVYCDLINDNIETGKLTNATPGKHTSLRLFPVYDKGPTGKTTNPESQHAINSLRRKKKRNG